MTFIYSVMEFVVKIK